ncbi:MAG: hypothetical protein MUF39_06725 [Cyclobacteriaceae bacterium]|nr:hypothetical protein [Cyclobacteriaceae bacterium]
MLNLGSTRENSPDGSTVMLVLSHPSPGAGMVDVTIDSEKAVYGIDYVTEPAALNGKISLPVAVGADKLEFKVLPLNNNTINGEREISYALSASQGSVILGTELSHKLLITDDELYGLPKGYTTAAGNGWSDKKAYEYDEQGRVTKVITQQNALVITENYHYNAAGVLTKITESDFSETIFIYDNDGKVVKSEKYKDGILKAYKVFSYDPAGNVGEVAWFTRQPSGDIILSMVFVYLYYDNGNIYKRMVFNPVQDSEELVQVSEETYDGYLQKENLFPVYELVPGKSAQPWLPTTYHYSNAGIEYSYAFTYEFDEAGRMIKRNVLRNGGIVETNRYEYY